MNGAEHQESETQAMHERYAKRHIPEIASRYDPLSPAVYLSQQERERILIRHILKPHLAPLHDKHLIEVGCGNGMNLVQLLRMGFRPENLVANELLPERLKAARSLLPSAVEILAGDATQLQLPEESFDAALLSTVFTSILDDTFQQHLAEKIWTLIKPGGGIIWYDFIYNNPSNPDVRGVNLGRLRQLFPESHIDKWRVTLAPPISRQVCSLHPRLYSLFNTIPLLRSHLLCWIKK